jgi:hypothetical protein
MRHSDSVALLYPQKLALTLPTSGGRLVGIVPWQTQATKIVCLFFYCFSYSVLHYIFSLNAQSFEYRMVAPRICFVQ